MENIYEELELLKPTSDIQLRNWLMFNDINCELIVNYKQKQRKKWAIFLLPSPPHWVLKNKEDMKVFDSFGSGPGVFYYDQFLTDYEPIFPFQIFQGYNTAVCGEYCCLYLKYCDYFTNIFKPTTCTQDTWKIAAEVPMNSDRINNDRYCINLWYSNLSNDVKNEIRSEFN